VLWMAVNTLRAFTREHGVAGAATDRALMLNPNSAHAWTERGCLFVALSQPGPAIEAFERAMRLSPFDRLRRIFTNGIAIAHLVAQRYEEGLHWAERTLREEPGYRLALLGKAVACAQLDRIAEAREALGQMRESRPELTDNRPLHDRVVADSSAGNRKGLRRGSAQGRPAGRMTALPPPCCANFLPGNL
jgi:tetratricopeptide (TPR) repeat protein